MDELVEQLGIALNAKYQTYGQKGHLRTQPLSPKMVKALARAALAEIEAAGYRVVLVEPTEKIIKSGAEELRRELGIHDSAYWGKGIAVNVYRAMIAAAP